MADSRTGNGVTQTLTLQRTWREQVRQEETSECRSIGWNEKRVGAWTGGSRWIKCDMEQEPARGERQRGCEQFLADFGSRSVLLPSSWTSLVAGVNYWDCTHIHTQAEECTHVHTLTQPVIQGHLASLVWTRGEKRRRCQTEKLKSRELTHKCQSTVGVFYVINGILSSCTVSSW